MNERDADRIKEAFERLASVVQDSYETAVKGAASMQETNLHLTQNIIENHAELLKAQAEIQSDLSLRTLDNIAEQAQRHRESLLQLSRGSLDAYEGFLGSLSSYYEELSTETNDPGS